MGIRTILVYVTQNVLATERTTAPFTANLTRTDLLAPGCWRSKLLLEINELMLEGLLVVGLLEGAIFSMICCLDLHCDYRY